MHPTADPAAEFAPTLDRERLERLRQGAVVIPGSPAVFELTGMGALQCLQGLLTNDIVQPGEHSLVYGALLTPKGMLVVDYWVLRRPQSFLMVAELRGRSPSHDLFTRQLPPRLAKASDLTGTLAVAWLYGEQALGTLRFAGLGPVPEQPGRVTEGGAGRDGGGATLLMARPGPTAPFSAILVGEQNSVDAAVDALVRSGAARGDETDRQAARIIAGWPTLGAEIDDKTLPQEVRYDEIDGVSYTKGCYTGQETVARLHFRGHTNRELRGLLWRTRDPRDGTAVRTVEGKEVGTVRSTLSLPDRVLGLALMRREIAAEEMVTAGGLPAEVCLLPFTAREFER